MPTELPPELVQMTRAGGAVWQVSLFMMLAAGLFLLLMGRKLARPACAGSGLVLGGLTGFMAVQSLASPVWLIPVVLVGALVGCIASYLLFRLWMGLSFGLILAAVAPSALLIWQGQPPPVLPPPPPEHRTGLGEQERAAPLLQIFDRVRDASTWHREAVKQWWTGLSTVVRQRAMAGAGIGAMAGLLIGLVAPYLAASLESALLGGLLLTISGVTLTQHYSPKAAQWLTGSSHRTLLVLGLITFLGLSLQWTIFRRKADN